MPNCACHPLRVTANSYKTLLAFDFGTRKIGVAIGYPSSGHTFPLPILHARNGIPDWNRLTRLIEEWQPDALLVGVPYNMDNSIGELGIRAKKFAQRLTGRYGLPCKLIDERLTTFEAKERIRSTEGVSAGDRADSVDSLAAQILLEQWFQTGVDSISRA